MKNLLITTITHGDEGFATPIIKRLSQKYGFAWRKNNIRAYKQGLRFTQKDLNRSGPGNPKSALYEERLAYRLIKTCSKYSPVIDIHGSTASCGVFALISEPSTQNIELAKKLDVQNVVLWPSMRATEAPLTQFIPNSLEIECGPKDSPQTDTELNRVLDRFLASNPCTFTQNFYIVTGLLQGKIDEPMKDFEEISYKNQTFFPLLVDQYSNIKCYIMQKIGVTLAV